MITAERTLRDHAEADRLARDRTKVTAENWTLFAGRGFEPVLNISKYHRSLDDLPLEQLRHEGYELLLGNYYDHESGQPEPDRELLTVYIGPRVA